MKNWWRRWSYDIPLALSDALWDVLVVQFAAFLDRLTVRKVIEFIVIALLAMAFAQTFPFDLAMLFASDMLMYLEFIIAVRLAAGKLHFMEMLRQTWRVAQFARRLLRAATDRPVLRINRWRERRSAARIARPRRDSDSSGDGRGFGAAWAR
jgi:hypothetical protein